MVIQSFITYRDEIHKKLELCLESNINVPKRARVATFPLSIVDHFCLLQQYKLSKIKIRLPRLIVIVPYGSIRDHSWLCDQPLKKPTLCIEREQHVSLTACQQSETQVCGIWTVNREIKIHVYAKRQTWICTTWPSFSPIFRLPFIASTQK